MGLKTHQVSVSFPVQADADEQALTGAFQQPAPVPGAGFRSLTIKKWVV